MGKHVSGTNKAPERIWAIPERNCTVYMSGNSPITAQDGPFTHRLHGTANEYVRRDLFDAMQDRAEKAEAEVERPSEREMIEEAVRMGLEMRKNTEKRALLTASQGTYL